MLFIAREGEREANVRLALLASFLRLVFSECRANRYFARPLAALAFALVRGLSYRRVYIDYMEKAVVALCDVLLISVL